MKRTLSASSKIRDNVSRERSYHNDGAQIIIISVAGYGCRVYVYVFNALVE